jgi:hypothetical protein
MLDETGRHWSRRVRAGVTPFSRDGARVAFKELEAIAKVEHLPETRKQIYQDRQTDELRAERREFVASSDWGDRVAPSEATPSNGAGPVVDLDALLAALTPEQRAELATKINRRMGPGMGPMKKSPGPLRTLATGTAWNFKTSKERAMGLEPTTSSLGRRRKNKR